VGGFSQFPHVLLAQGYRRAELGQTPSEPRLNPVWTPPDRYCAGLRGLCGVFKHNLRWTDAMTLMKSPHWASNAIFCKVIFACDVSNQKWSIFDVLMSTLTWFRAYWKGLHKYQHIFEAHQEMLGYNGKCTKFKHPKCNNWSWSLATLNKQ
jgi:hypothetical protein